MTTLADLQAAIADDIDDTTGEYSSQIVSAIQAAQRYCERQTYYFNETRDQTFSTVQDQEWYGSSDNANIPTLVHIQAVYSEDAQGQRTTLRRMRPEELEYLSDNSAASGEPYAWAYFNQQIRLYPIPGATTYTIRLQLGPYRLTALSEGTDTNAWLDEAYDLLKARAKYVLYKDTLKDPQLALEAANDWKDWDNALTSETTSRKSSGRIEPDCL